MQQPAPMIPVMPSFPPNNITTEQIQKVLNLCSSFFFDSLLRVSLFQIALISRLKNGIGLFIWCPRSLIGLLCCLID